MVTAMMELPEAVCLAMQANDLITGKIIFGVEAAMHPHKFAWYNGDPKDYPAMLAGRSVDRAVPVGGQLELQMGDMRLLFGDGVNLRYCLKGDREPSKHQLRLEFDDASALIGSVQMYGGLSAFLDGTYANPYYLIAKEKPSPLSDRFDADWFGKLVESSSATLSLKAFLATEQRIPGLGNGVLQDILFNAALHPKRKLGTLDKQELARLFRSVRDTLSDMAAGGGRDTETDLIGCPGHYETRLSRNTTGKPCRVCGSIILKEPYMGGSIYFCPGCQPVP
jgi:formamidopyrimidine-DNA glycosylase